MENQFSWERFEKMPVIGIARNIPYADLMHILPLFDNAGLNSIEITMNSPNCVEEIRWAAKEHGDKINIGAGTVCNLLDLDKAVAAGAQFIVTPIVDKKVIKACVDKRMPIFCGAFTLTEIQGAWSAGADMVKVFPSTLGGPEYIKDIKGPLNKIRLLPTGGVSKENCLEFLKAGAEGLGMGSQLFDKQYVKAKNWSALERHFLDIAKKIKAYKSVN